MKIKQRILTVVTFPLMLVGALALLVFFLITKRRES